jgi:hypothetical protein
MDDAQDDVKFRIMLAGTVASGTERPLPIRTLLSVGD